MTVPRSAVRSLARGGALAIVASLTMLAGSPGAASQERETLDDREVARLLEEASTLETRGELSAAEDRLRRVLADDPLATGALTSLERVLRGLRELDRVLPAIDAYLERRPTDPRIRSLQLEVLVRLDSVPALEEAAREWIDLAPNEEEPYRQAVVRFGDALGPERALEVLREGRERLERPDFMALAAGDLRLRTGEREEAGREWGRAMLREETGAGGVLRRIDRVPGDARPVVRAALDVIEEGDPPPSVLGGAARLALDGGMVERAIVLAAGAADGLAARARKGYLVDFARRAEHREAVPAAVWAYEWLRDEAETAEEARALDERVAELASGSGDVERAVRARERIARSHPSGSPVRRRALAAMVELEIDGGSLESAREKLADFRAEYPDAGELDRLAALLARRLSEKGDTAEAGDVVEGVSGPRSALERGYLHLEAGDVDRGREELESAVAELEAGEATDVLELLVVLEGAEAEAARLAGRAAALERRGFAGRAVEAVAEGLRDVPVDDRPALLALAARVAEGSGDASKAADLRARIVADFPDAPQYPEAALRLARQRAERADQRESAVEILEELIVSRPGSAVTPDARRELERLRAEIPGRSR